MTSKPITASMEIAPRALHTHQATSCVSHATIWKTSPHRIKMQNHLLGFASALLATALFPASGYAQTASPEKPTSQAAATQEKAPAGEPDRASAYFHLAMAHTYAEMATTQGKPEYATRAIEEYKLALNADPQSPYLNNGLAELYYKTGRIRDAVLAAQDLVKKDPQNFEAHKLLGRIYLRSLGDGQQNGPTEKVLELAIAEYEKIVSLAPKDLESRLLLGRLYTLNHDSVKAEAEFKAAQDMDPSSEEVVLNLARLYSDQGDLKRSIQVLEAVPVDDRTPQMEYILASSYEQNKDLKNAIAAYRRSIDLEPENTEIMRSLGQALLNDSQFEEALKIFKQLIAADPQDPQALLRISEIERRQGHYEEALSYLKKAKALTPRALEVRFNEALLQDSLGHYEEATTTLESLVSDSEHPSGAYSEQEKSNLAIFLGRLAYIYQEQNRIKSAVATFGKMIDLGGEYAIRGYQGQIDVYREAHKYKEAYAVGETATQKFPKDLSINLTFAGQLVDIGKSDEGLQKIKSLLTGGPEDRDTYVYLAQTHIRLHHWKEAEEALAKAEPMATKQDEKLNIAFLRGTIAERQKHLDSAEQIFRQILASDPDNIMTLNYLGYMLADKGMKLDEAIKMIRKAVTLDPQNGAYLDSLGWAYFKMGQYTLAEETLRKAVERLSTDPTVHDHLGQLYEKTGRLKLAAAQWEIAVSQLAQTLPGDSEPGEMGRVTKKLESARIRLAKQEAQNPPKAAVEQ